MKIQAKAQKLRRFVKRGKQFSQNQMLANNRTEQPFSRNEKLIKLVETLMSNWKTTMKLLYNNGWLTTDQIKIKRVIFQGDSFSPLLLCLALVSLTSVYLYYIDDLKLYSKKEQEQVGELKIVKQFSDDIGMEFGLEKCAKACLKKGKLTSAGNIVIDEDTELQELDQEGYTNAWV